MSKIRECIDIVGDFDCMECGEVQMASGCQEDKAPCKWNVLSDAAHLELEAYEKVVSIAKEVKDSRCPWPKSVWTMTEQEYCAAVPDPKTRTAISGLLMRSGWQICKNDVMGTFDEALASLDTLNPK